MADSPSADLLEGRHQAVAPTEQRTLALDLSAQGGPLQKLHRQIGNRLGSTRGHRPMMDAEVAHPADIAVAHSVGELHLDLHPGDGLRLLEQVAAQGLQGHAFRQGGIEGVVHLAHAAPADEAIDPVTADGLAGFERCR